MKIIVCCANGAGSSLMLKMAAQKATKALNIPVEKLHHCPISEAKTAASGYDLVLTSNAFVEMFAPLKQKGVVVIGLKNVMSAKEIEEKLKEAGLGQ